MTAEDDQILNGMHEIVLSLLQEDHIANSSELDYANRAKVQDGKDIDSMISVLIVHKRHREVNPLAAPTGMLGLQKPVDGSEADSISETIHALTQLKARLKN